MTTINLKDFYYWYLTNELVEVPDEVAEELMASKRREAAHAERVRYPHFSLFIQSILQNVPQNILQKLLCVAMTFAIETLSNYDFIKHFRILVSPKAHCIGVA